MRSKFGFLLKRFPHEEIGPMDDRQERAAPSTDWFWNWRPQPPSPVRHLAATDLSPEEIARLLGPDRRRQALPSPDPHA